MKNYSFVADICGTLYGTIEAESAEEAREKLTENLRLIPSLNVIKTLISTANGTSSPNAMGIVALLVGPQTMNTALTLRRKKKHEKDQIKIGKKYSNGKGRVREVVDVGDYPLYSGQTDHDCVKYEIINDGSKETAHTGTSVP